MRSICLAGDEVRDVLSGRRTQLWRVMKCDSPRFPAANRVIDMGMNIWRPHDTRGPIASIECPFGWPGDLLWAQEEWGNRWHRAQPRVFYRATDENDVGWHPDFDGWQSAETMPQWASRLTLELVARRVERVSAITGADARASGVTDSVHDDIAIEHFAQAWNRKHGAGNFADVRPFVWVLTVRPVTP